MYKVIINFFLHLKEYFRFTIFGDKDENELREIYKTNDIDINKLYIILSGLNKVVAKEKDYEKILIFLDREIKYGGELLNYENILNIKLEISDKVKRIELMTNLNLLKKSFEKIIHIRNEYYKEHQDKKNL
jgi:hypothetical protein